MPMNIDQKLYSMSAFARFIIEIEKKKIENL